MRRLGRRFAERSPEFVSHFHRVAFAVENLEAAFGLHGFQTGFWVFAGAADYVKQRGAERLPEMVPVAVYMTLTPFLGAEEAYALATEGNNKGGRPG